MRANAVTNRVKCKVAAILKNETGQSYCSICNEELTSFLRFRVSFIKKFNQIIAGFDYETIDPPEILLS